MGENVECKYKAARRRVLNNANVEATITVSEDEADDVSSSITDSNNFIATLNGKLQESSNPDARAVTTSGVSAPVTADAVTTTAPMATTTTTTTSTAAATTA